MLDRSDELDEVIDQYLKSQVTDQPLSSEELLSRYPHLASRLTEALRRLELIEAARQSANVASLNEGAVNRRIGHFELLECVGVGSFGAVWRAIDEKLQRIVAIKLPRQHLGGAILQDFLREARIVARLKHPNIVNVYEVGTDHDTAFIVSDFIDGVPLDVWATEYDPNSHEIAALFVKLAEAVETAHRAGVIHRDLKPSNILMTDAGEPAITDFGLAKQHGPDETIALEERILGTPAYMSPEQAAGRSAEADARSDVYSLGVVLFELMTGERPFRGPSNVLIQRVIHDDPPSPRKLKTDLPRDLETICLKCLEKDPKARYQSAKEVAEEFGRFLRGEPILARPLRISERVWRWSARNPMVAGLGSVIALLFLVAVIAGWWFYFDERQDRHELMAALEQEDYMRQIFLQTEEFQHLGIALESAAQDSQVLELMTQISADKQLMRLCETLRELRARHELTEWHSRQKQLVEHPKQIALQNWLEQVARRSEIGVFAWFVLDEHGTQVARVPSDEATGRNYAWRTYFHGGNRDFRDYAEYMRETHGSPRRISKTYLSRGLFTEVTNRFVVVVSTPIISNERFVGVLGLMVELRAMDEKEGVP